MTSDGPTSEIHLDQKRATENGWFVILGTGMLLYVCAASWVYWAQTGSWTIGVGGSISTVGSVVILAPVALVAIALVARDRGPFRFFYEPRSTVVVADSGMEWRIAGGQPRLVAWPEVGGVSHVSSGWKTTETVYRPNGVELAMLAGPFVIEGTRTSVGLAEAVMDARPLEFEPIDPSHRDRGCIAKRVRGRDPAITAVHIPSRHRQEEA